MEEESGTHGFADCSDKCQWLVRIEVDRAGGKVGARKAER